METLENLRAHFKADTFAMGQGAVIEDVSPEGARCSLVLRQDQKNAMGYAQGGLLYTLADFTFAVAANAVRMGTVTLDSNIHYLRGVTAGKITATATVKNQSRTICVYQVEVADEAGKPLALATMTGYYKGKEANSL